MKTYLISYDLRVPETSEDYKRIIKYIQGFTLWAKPLRSVWLIKTNDTVANVRDGLILQSDKNDGLLVIDVTAANWGTSGVSKSVTDWMKENM